ncbi:MAG: hypothetical protein ABIA04_15295 [Pseudomonadota bacterium]
MAFYWAIFKKDGSNIFRFDTRIYLESIAKPEANDTCIGAIAGKNPGSAKPTDLSISGIQKIKLSNDKLLPNVRSIVEKAYEYSNKTYSRNSYIQVQNLFYLCNPSLDEAIIELSNYDKPPKCDSENRVFPWRWYVWGGSNKKNIANLKKRFIHEGALNNIYYHTESKCIKNQMPDLDHSARHTQGLSHDLIVPSIAKLLS